MSNRILKLTDEYRTPPSLFKELDSEEVLFEDAYFEDEEGRYMLPSTKDFEGKLIPFFGDIEATPNVIYETKNYKRVEDRIVSKNTANFPSLIMIFDRREK